MGYEAENFTITSDHLELMRSMIVKWDYCEYGAPEIDPKRPYGNSDVASDIHEILGWEWPPDDQWDLEAAAEKRARELHVEMKTVLQIAVQHPGEPLIGEWHSPGFSRFKKVQP